MLLSVIDQIIKVVVKLNMNLVESIHIFDWFQIQYIQNNGIGRILYEQNRKDVSTYQNVLKSKDFGILSYTEWTPFTGTSFTLNAFMSYARITLPTPSTKNKPLADDVTSSGQQCCLVDKVLDIRR